MEEQALECVQHYSNILQSEEIRQTLMERLKPSLFLSGAIVNELQLHYEAVSSSDYYCSSFQSIRMQEESKILDFSTSHTEDYNLPFSLAELKSSLASAKSTAPGSDNIHNSVLQNLPDIALLCFCSLYSTVFGWKTLYPMYGKQL